jgi:alcohol dehydrogenase YqhD (iron-dependent ADH family)
MAYVMDAGPAKFRQYAERVWGVHTKGKTEKEVALEGIQKTKAFFKSIGAPTSLKDAGIDDTRIPEMAKKSVRNGPIGAYKRLNEKDVEAILRACL